MGHVTARLTDGASFTFEDRALNQGGEKTVFMSRDRQSVVGFYHGRLPDRLERVHRLSRILTRYNPTEGAAGAYWRPYFSWPTGVVDGGGVPPSFLRDHGLCEPALGVVTPHYRSCFYFLDRHGNRQEKEVKWFTARKAYALVPEGERGTLLTRLQVCTRLARAVRRMHFAGLAHSDLSNKNVLIDPRHGDACVIDIDSLVVPGVAPPSVLGTPGYIAPEVLGATASPSIATDKHALAVLIYQILLNRHPLMGRRVNSTRSAEQDEVLSMGSKALFIEHPSDRSNPPLTPIRVAYPRLGPFLAPLVQRAFVDALHHPARRPDAAEWEVALYRTLQLVHPSPSGRDWAILAPGLPAETFGSERLPTPYPVARFLREGDRGLMDEGQRLVIFHHLTLHAWHLRHSILPDEHADRAALGYFAWHNHRWWLVNTSGAAMQVLGGDPVPHGQGLELRPGLELRTGDDAQARVFRIEWQR